MSDEHNLPDAEIIGPDDDLQTSLPMLSEQYVAKFEGGIQQFRRWVTAAIRGTHAGQWINHGTLERPNIQLQGPGAEVLKGPLGVGYDVAPDRKRVNTVEPDGSVWYSAEVEGWLIWRVRNQDGRVLHESRIFHFAHATSLDRFFTAKPGWDARVGWADVLNKAMTHWFASGLARLVGLRNPDPALLSAAGIRIGDIPRPDYSGTRSFEQAQGTISEAQAKRLYAIYKKQNIPEETFKRKLVLIGAVDKDGKASTYAVTRGVYDALVSWCEAGGQEALGRDPGQEG